MSKTRAIFRWLAVIPGAVICAFLAAFPIHWAVVLLQLFGFYGDDSAVLVDGKTLLAAVPPEMLERFGYAFFTPFVMTIIGAKIAPNFKFQTAIALAILWALIFGGVMTFVITKGMIPSGGWLQLAVTCILGLSGVGFGLYKVYKRLQPLKDDI
ncbi:MAG: hypothetical protein PHR28_01435 [candidate division Zixibacteria bacterium]|nr:hypothetical protein [candidate division Zixibacteria bacterium]